MSELDDRPSVLDHVRARFTDNAMAFERDPVDAGVFLGQCPRHRDRSIRLEWEAVDDTMKVGFCPGGCLPLDTIRQLGLDERARVHVPAGITAELTWRRLGVRDAFMTSAGTGSDPYQRMVAALDAGGFAGRRSDVDGVRGVGRYECPACGAAGDGHGLKIDRKDDGAVLFYCHNCGDRGHEILAGLGVSWADVGWAGSAPPRGTVMDPNVMGPPADTPVAPGTEPAQGVPEDRRAQRLATAVDALRLQREARRTLDREERAPRRRPEVLSLRERLTRPRQRAAFRIESWAPVGARIVLAAQYKAGKTTATGNLARSLVDGDPWLGQHKVTPIDGTLVILDFEMSADQLDDWLADQRIVADDRIVPISMRGNATAFDILDEHCRAEWAAQLRELGAGYVVLDCLRPVLDALGLDENHDAGRLLVPFDMLLVEAEVSEAAVVHHMGHTGERSRGDSRIRDWPDVEWRLVRENEEPNSPRFISAFGRDVDQPEAQLSYDGATRHLTVIGGSRGNAASMAALVDIAILLAENPGVSGREIEQNLITEHAQKVIRAGLKLGVDKGLIEVAPGAKRARLHSLCVSALECVTSASTHSSECVSAFIENAHAHTPRGTVVRWSEGKIESDSGDEDDEPPRPLLPTGPTCVRCDQRLVTALGLARGVCTRCEPASAAPPQPRKGS